jgi:hypothetical protein
MRIRERKWVKKRKQFNWLQAFYIFFGVGVGLLILLSFLLKAPEPLQRFPNRCPTNSSTFLLQSRTKAPAVRPPTLVVYVYSESDELKKDNLEFFIKYP